MCSYDGETEFNLFSSSSLTGCVFVHTHPPTMTPTLLNEQIRDSISPGKERDTVLSEFPRKRGRLSKEHQDRPTWRSEEREKRVGGALYKNGRGNMRGHFSS